MVRQWSPPYNRSKSLPALKRYGQRGGAIYMRRKRLGGTIFGPRGEYYPHLPQWYKRRYSTRGRRKSR